MNTYLLVIRKDDGGVKKIQDIGDIIEAKEELPGGVAPWFGRVPLMSSPADGHAYGGMLSIFKVLGMTLPVADQYMSQQFDSNGVGFFDELNILYHRGIKRKAWKFDINKLPANRRNRHRGNKRKNFTDKFDPKDGNKNNWVNKAGESIEDDEMTLAEFESWMTMKPTPQGLII